MRRVGAGPDERVVAGTSDVLGIGSSLASNIVRVRPLGLGTIILRSKTPA
jgi:hypothetical protein